MPRLDAERIALLRSLTLTTDAISRQIDADLVQSYELPLVWFEVMTALQQAGGSLRVNELRDVLQDPGSSLSRRLDRMVEAGHVERCSTPIADDRRSITVSLTREGRLLWRDANVVYRRGVQRSFARVLTDSDITALQRLLGKLAREV